MADLTVGLGEQFSTLNAAVNAASAGDTILVNAGTYVDDFTTTRVSLTIQSVGGMANFVANSAPSNGKAIMTVDADLSINGLGFFNAAVPDGNGAGIRYEGGNLSINNSLFQGNQDGLLAAPDPTGTISINHSEFTGSGTGTGQTHNIYVNDVAQLTIKNSYFTDESVGHDIKSRAQNTTIQDNRITDGPNGTASYEIDLPNAGNATITGNVIEKGQGAQNNSFISYGEEGVPYSSNSLAISNNVFISNLTGWPSNAVGNIPSPDLSFSFSDNTLYGMSSSQLNDGTGMMIASNNSFLPLPGPPLDASQPFAVPEPGSLGLLMLAAAALRTLRRRKFR